LAKSTKSLRLDRKDGEAVFIHVGNLWGSELGTRQVDLFFRQNGLDGFGEFGFGAAPLELEVWLAAFENQTVRDSCDSICRGKLCRLVECVVTDIKLGNFDFSLILIRQLVDGGCQGLAGRTPSGRKVDHDGNAALDYFFFPVVIAEFHDMSATGMFFAEELSD